MTCAMSADSHVRKRHVQTAQVGVEPGQGQGEQTGRQGEVAGASQQPGVVSLGVGLMLFNRDCGECTHVCARQPGKTNLKNCDATIALSVRSMVELGNSLVSGSMHGCILSLAIITMRSNGHWLSACAAAPTRKARRMNPHGGCVGTHRTRETRNEKQGTRRNRR